MRSRTKLISAVMRVRNNLAFATHKFFQERGYQYIHTPIITASDCEGAGELFQVTTSMPAHNGPINKMKLYEYEGQEHEEVKAEDPKSKKQQKKEKNKKKKEGEEEPAEEENKEAAP
jgi:hypothetical protein